MGLNFAGFVCNRQLSEAELTSIVGHPVTAAGTASFADAASAAHEADSVDVLHTEQGTLGLVGIDHILALRPSENAEMFSFLISEVSDTYYGQLTRNGTLVGKSMVAMGTLVEQHGDAMFRGEQDTAPRSGIIFTN